jgi:hypothetical protein
MPYEAWESNNRRSAEMDDTYQVEVASLGRILEGEGQIKSTLPETEYDNFAEALRQSVTRIEEPDCAACGDGRLVKSLANGQTGRIRPRKFGGSLSPVVMMSLADRLHIAALQDGESIYDASEEIAAALGNKESGHEDCGAAGGLVKHIETLSVQSLESPNVQVVKTLVMAEGTGENADELLARPIRQASAYAEILKSQDWIGSDYVDRLAQIDPSTVEILETDDSPTHGHAEQAVVLIDGPVDEEGRPIHTIDKGSLMELSGYQAFIVNLNEIRRDADILGGTSKQKAEFFAAALLHHVAGVYPSLGDGSHPVFMVRVA